MERESRKMCMWYYWQKFKLIFGLSEAVYELVQWNKSGPCGDSVWMLTCVASSSTFTVEANFWREMRVMNNLLNCLKADVNLVFTEVCFEGC